MNPPIPGVAPQAFPQFPLQQVSTSLSYSGPIPPPELLRQYNEIIPGLAERIVGQAERQTNHRIELEKTVINSDIKRSWAGLIIGGMLAFFVTGAGALLVHNGHDGAGAWITGGGLASVVGVFVYGTQQRRKERTEKANLMIGNLPAKKK
jgi:uncharacterized membrane protein